MPQRPPSPDLDGEGSPPPLLCAAATCDWIPTGESPTYVGETSHVGLESG